MTNPRIEHDADGERFVAEVEGGTAELSYLAREGALDLIHTYVPDEARNEGVGSALAEFAVAHARQNGLRIIPSCPFVRAWLNDHPEAADVVDATPR